MFLKIWRPTPLICRAVCASSQGSRFTEIKNCNSYRVANARHGSTDLDATHYRSSVRRIALLTTSGLSRSLALPFGLRPSLVPRRRLRSGSDKLGAHSIEMRDLSDRRLGTDHVTYRSDKLFALGVKDHDALELGGLNPFLR
jgi:hypothetical protein